MKCQSFLLLAIVVCWLSATGAKRQSCADGKGQCIKSNRDCKTVSSDESCRNGFKCCVKGNGKSVSIRRKCRARKKCSRNEFGNCIKAADTCNGLTANALCKGASCKCCVTGGGDRRCKSLPTCRFRGGLCVNKKKVNAVCVDATVDENGCKGKRCSCCYPNEKVCSCGIANIPEVTTNDVANENNTTSVDNATLASAVADDTTTNPSMTDRSMNLMPNEYPWLVGIKTESDDTMYECTGSIINSNYVLTAASCVDELDASDVKVGIADYDQYSTDDDIPDVTRMIDVEEIIIQKKFESDFISQNNIALLKLATQLDLISITEIKPVCLPTEIEDFEGEEAFTASWGSTNAETEDLAATPMYTNLTILDSECGGNETIGTDKITGKNICATRNSLVSCTGDAGTPLTVAKDGRHVLVGLLAVPKCPTNSEPEIHTRITKYLKWIRKSIDRKGSFCS